VIRRLGYDRVRGCAGRTSSTWRLKKVLASMFVLGALSYLTVGGTFAVLNSQVANAQGAAATGTLTFGNLVNTNVTTCYSYGGPASPGNVNNACDALFSSASQNYPGALATSKVTVTNNGSINIAHLSVYMPSCTSVATPGAPTPGGGNICAAGGALFYIQETDSSGVATTCRFPAAAGSCALNAGTLSTFATNASTTATALDLGAGPASGQARYFVIGMELPSTASNTLQGQAAQFGLTWRVTS
jgi:hypothetical protein